jgi:glycosyl transferase family 87
LQIRSDVVVGRRFFMMLGFAIVALGLAVDIANVDFRAGIDFHTYLAAANVGLQQGWSHIYDQGLVALAQKDLVPAQRSQPFLSPPTVAYLTAPLSPLPYSIAFLVWAIGTFMAFALALAWAGSGKGLVRWIPVFGALSTWWVMHAVDVGQVVPLVAAGTVVAWRLLRDKRDIAAGLVLATILLKPNTAILVPLALLIAGRVRAFGAWVAATLAVFLLVFLTLGANGMSAYMEQLMAPLPSGADSLTLHGAFGAAGAVAMTARVLIVGIVFATAYRLRNTPGLALAAGILGSLISAPYLHGSDLCLLAAAGWMVWQDRTWVAWRIALGVAWVAASPFLYLYGKALPLRFWPWLEIALLVALLLSAWRPFTARADSRERAPA